MLMLFILMKIRHDDLLFNKQTFSFYLKTVQEENDVHQVFF